jgi:guanylate cyclase
MLSPILKAWLCSGVGQSSAENYNPIRITNTVSLLIIGVSLLQLPVALTFWQTGGNKELIIIFVTVTLLLFVPVLNNQGARTSAKLFLIAVYIFNIVVSCIHWQIDLNIQHFLLLGIFVCPFLFGEQEMRLVLVNTVLFACIFVAIETWFQITQSLRQLNLHQAVFKFSSASLLALSCVLCSYHIWQNVNRNRRKLAEEKMRSDRLLLNILPFSIAERLKSSDTLIADYFEQASILFADIKDFTPMCKTRSPQQLVSLLNEVFYEFDLLSEKYGLEKMKTRGDEYMAAGGLPLANNCHASQCCDCALDMQKLFARLSEQYKLNTGLRIGIGCGEVVAGVIGKNKFSYDIWGDAVNLASRMESHGECHKIQVTQKTYQLCKHNFEFSERGETPIKGMGIVNTYWLLGRKNI